MCQPRTKICQIVDPLFSDATAILVSNTREESCRSSTERVRGLSDIGWDVTEGIRGLPEVARDVTEGVRGLPDVGRDVCNCTKGW